MSFRINVVLKDEKGDVKLIYNFIENKAKALEDALRLAVKNPEWRKKHLIKVDKEQLEKLFNVIAEESEENPKKVHAVNAEKERIDNAGDDNSDEVVTL